VISGIVHTLKSGARWRGCPAEFGRYTTVYNRFNRWSRQGLRLQMFEALTGHNGIFDGAACPSP
jgi:transposase